MIQKFQTGDIVVTRANNLAIVGNVSGAGDCCSIKIVLRHGGVNINVDDDRFSGVPVETLTRTGLHVKAIEFVGVDNGFTRNLIQYQVTYRHPVLTSGELGFAVFEKWADEPQPAKDEQIKRAIESACKVMDEICHHWQLVRV